MSLECLVAELDKWLARTAHCCLTEEIQKHQEMVGGLAGIECLLQAVFRDCRWFEISQFGKVGAFRVQHPNYIPGNRLLDYRLDDGIGHFDVADQRHDE